LTSIIIPTTCNYAAVKRVKRCIEETTKCGSYELLVVDTTPQFLGCVKSINTGLKEAVGDVLVLMNDDCQPQANWLPPLISAIERGATLCSAQWQYARLGGHCLAMPRDTYERYGGFDERYRHWCADHHLEMIISQDGGWIGQVPESNVVHDPWDEHRIHYRRSLYQEKSGLPNTGQWYLEDQATFEAYWGTIVPSDFWDPDWQRGI